jgi:hypothetical protein
VWTRWSPPVRSNHSGCTAGAHGSAVGGGKTYMAVNQTDITVWTISALLAIGVGWSRYAKWKTRDRLVRDLAAMDPERREKVLSRLNPDLAMQAREDLMRRFNIS